jgi:inner membrane transporter RhtA
MGAVLSVQCGAALATTLFDTVGPGGAVLLRSGSAALVLLAIAGRSVGALGARPHRDVVLFGIALAGMNLGFYAALDRIPLGIAVTLEFVGPLAVAVLGSRRRRDLVWAALAAAGIVLLADGSGGGGIDAVGALLALFAGSCWGAYILLSARVGQRYAGLGGLALAMTISALLVAPFGLAQGRSDLLSPPTLAVGLAVGMLSSAVPYGLELEALRRLPNAVFGVLMSIEPAVAALVGFVALSQGLALREALGIALVVLASAGALGTATAPAPQEV